MGNQGTGLKRRGLPPILSLLIPFCLLAGTAPAAPALAAGESTAAALELTLLAASLGGGATGFKLPDTGQTACYDSAGSVITCPSPAGAYYGQDAQFSRNPPSYTDNLDGTVTDTVTGLIWQKSPDLNANGQITAADKLTYDQAQAYAAALTLAGHSDWRLPTIKELYSLIDFRGTDPSGMTGTDTSGLTPFLNTAYFAFGYGDVSAGERVIDAQFASSTLYVSNTANDGGRTMFGVNFADGRIKGYGLSIMGTAKTFYVLCVRGGASYGKNDLMDNGDGTVTDRASGLMWSQNDSGAGLNWQQALAWVKDRNAAHYLGRNDWRLPNAKELQSIVDYTRSPATSGTPALSALFRATAIYNEAGQVDYPCYWTSTTHANWTGLPGPNAAYVAFGRAMGYLGGMWQDVHGAGAQRGDSKAGDPAAYPYGHGPQGDAVRIYNFVRLVRDAG